MGLFEEIKKDRLTPVNIIHGTDWWTDCDDLAALRLLLNAHNAGVIRLLGVGINSVMEASAPSVSAFCNERGLEIPIGVDKKAVRKGRGCRYQAALAAWPHTVASNDDCPDAVLLYRRLLSELDGAAVITEVGFPQIIMQLLKSGPDEISPRSGMELVREKVSGIWMMAGRWDRPGGLEYNLSAFPVCSAAGAYICAHCPVPVTFLGFECGKDVITGDRLDPADILFKGYEAHGSAGGRSSWDPLTVLAAVIGDPARAGYGVVRGTARVDPETGHNDFTPSPDGRHAYLVNQHPAAWYAARVNSLL